MSLAVTIVGDDRNHDLRLPSDLPLALLDDDLRRVTGASLVALTRSTGELLDPELSLRDNQVRDGAILQLRDRDEGLAVYDDIVDLVAAETAASRTAPASLLTAAVAAALCVPLVRFGTPAITGLLAAATVVLSGIAPRLSIRFARITPISDARGLAARSRVTAARRATYLLEHAFAVCTLASGAALATQPTTFAGIAGWCCIALIACRTPLPHGAPPAASLAAQRIAALLTAVTPAFALAAAGLVPGIAP